MGVKKWCNEFDRPIFTSFDYWKREKAYVQMKEWQAKIFQQSRAAYLLLSFYFYFFVKIDKSVHLHIYYITYYKNR